METTNTPNAVEPNPKETIDAIKKIERSIQREKPSTPEVKLSESLNPAELPNRKVSKKTVDEIEQRSSISHPEE